VAQLQDIYWAEKKLVKTLPKLEVAAPNIEFKQSETHVARLKEVFAYVK
jgi:ferritin-like metal-binding protein YciE